MKHTHNHPALNTLCALLLATTFAACLSYSVVRLATDPPSEAEAAWVAAAVAADEAHRLEQWRDCMARQHLPDDPTDAQYSAADQWCSAP